MTTEEISNRAKVRQWVREQIEDSVEIRIPELADEAVKVFSKNRKFLADLATETLRDMVYRIAQDSIQDTRMLRLTDGAIDREEVKRRSRSHSVFRGWLEHVGDRHVRLMDMSREDLLVAAEERSKRGKHELEIAALWRTLAEQLEGGQIVREKFSEEEIERMQEGLAHS